MTSNMMIHGPQRWEYCEVTRSSEEFLIHDLNEKGQEGWELVNVRQCKNKKGELSWFGFLKRPCGKHDVAPVQSTSQQQIRIEPLKK